MEDRSLETGTSLETAYQELDGHIVHEPDTLTTQAPLDPSSVSTTRVAVVSGLALGAAFSLAEYHRRVWWEDRSVEFHFHDNWGYARWADKLGHFVSSSFLTRYYAASFDWAGLTSSQAKAWGAGLAWTSMLYYEVLDGFGPTWGFSSGDLFFNTLGVGLTYAQWQLPELAPYTLKVSYWPSAGDEIITADYTGLTWWGTANLHTALPESVGRKVPRWMNLGLGYAARDPDERNNFLTSSYYYVGVDLELSELPIDHPVWNEAVKWLRYFHVPGPAIRLSPDPAFVLFAH